ncbi:helix-turn-helix domain-containing protein [Nocardia higoensis]|uniref:Helix-turn-helix domain-containing protein n=1 Tax=Nocardia higoensis TaxID=228599 RepID=A0ABS0DKW8_9NOCA|nr:helix-turn-helix domain-containing protein [Nocardia higoensis]MBF6358187.1 helix-turn-helix domain-containing protein [Nocardia higoensis]
MARKNTTPVEVQVAVQEKRAQALKMRREGKSQSEIARIMDVHKSTVSRWISDAIADITRESAEEWVQIIIQRYDDWLAGVYKDATKGDTWKIERALQIEDQRAKLLGLYKHAELKVVADAKGNVSAESKSMVGQLVEALHTAYTLDKASEASDEDGDDE